MKRTIALIFAIVMTMALVACGGSPAAGSSSGSVSGSGFGSVSGSGGTDLTDDSKTYKKEVTVGLWQAIDQLDPCTETGNTADTVYQIIYNRLVGFNWDTQEAIPELAESWEIENSSSYVFNLRKGVKFSNGEEMTADDIVFTFAERPTNVTGTTGSAVWNKIESIEVVNDYCVRFKLNTPDADFLYRLYIAYFGVMNREACEKDPEKGHLIGTNGWIVDSFSPNESVSFTRFDDSWVWKENGLNPTEELIFRFITEDTTRSIALQKGEVAADTSLNFASLTALAGDENVNTLTYNSESLTYVIFNMATGKLANDANLRKAVAYALDYDELVEIGTNGLGERAISYWGKSQYGLYEDFDEEYVHNVEKAKELLTAAGYPNGLEINLVTRPTEEALAPLVQAQLKEAGIKVNITATDSAGASAIVKSGEFDMMFYGISLQSIGDRFAFVPNINHSTNRAKYDNPEMMAKFTAALGETDDAKRKAIYKEIQIEMHDQIPYLPLYYDTWSVGYYDGVSGIQWTPNNKYDFTFTRWEE